MPKIIRYVTMFLVLYSVDSLFAIIFFWPISRGCQITKPCCRNSILDSKQGAISKKKGLSSFFFQKNIVNPDLHVFVIGDKGQSRCFVSRSTARVIFGTASQHCHLWDSNPQRWQPVIRSQTGQPLGHWGPIFVIGEKKF